MDAERFGERRLVQALAGLQAGILGAMLMLVWYALTSRINQQSIWAVPNLLAAAFYGDRSLRPEFGTFTWSGLALHFSLSGLLGAAFGALIPRVVHITRVGLLGLLLGLGWYYFSNALLWKKFNPLLSMYGAQPFMMVAHLLFGAALGLYPGFARSALRHFLLK